MSYFVIHHDCEQHSEDCHVVGPFDTDEAALAFINRHELFIPSDGGYSFAFTVGPDSGLTSGIAPADYRYEDEDDAVAAT